MAEEEEEQVQPAAEPTKGKGKKILLIVAVIFALLSVGGGIAAFVLSKKEKTTEELPADAAADDDSGYAEGSDDELEISEGEEALGAIVPLDTFLVNLNGGKYIRLQIQVEFETLDIPSRFYSRLVPIRDAIISLLTQQTADDLQAERGKEGLKSKIKALMNDVLRREEVKRIYFTQFVIQ